MKLTKNFTAGNPMKLYKWVYWFIFAVMAVGILYVLVAPFFGIASATSDKTPLGDRAYAFIQRTIRTSPEGAAFPVVALAASFLLGSLHALTPGHNKTLVGSYLAGAQGRLRHAVLIGMVTAFSHTASALVVGVFALSTAGQIASTRYLQWIGLPSGVLTMVLGVWLLRRHLSANSHHDHDHLHEHSHEHGHSHHHASPDPVTLGGLVALGLMHGIVPTFDAIAIILVALSIQKAALGAGLILAYSLGIGSVLVAVGALVVRTQTALLEHPRFERVSRHAPTIAAGVVVLLGLWLVLRTLVAL